MNLPMTSADLCPAIKQASSPNDHFLESCDGE